jgi:ribonuclease HI
MELLISIDGASRGNPGPGGIGVVIYNGAGEVIREVGEYIGETTNNVAEYTALIRGLEESLKLGGTSIRIQTDSELLARQISGVYRVRSAHLAEYYYKARGLLAKFKDAQIAHVPRKDNAHADRLASDAARRRADLRSPKPTAKKSSAVKPPVRRIVPKSANRPTVPKPRKQLDLDMGG